MGTNWTARFFLYLEYIHDLTEISGVPIGREVAEEAVDFYRISSCNEWIDIYSGDELVGFLITGWGSDCHPDCDYFIAQAFVKKDYRNRGLMKKAAGDYIKGHPGKYCMLILNGNAHAQGFWDVLFHENGYKQVPLRYLKGLDMEHEMPVGYEQTE